MLVSGGGNPAVYFILVPMVLIGMLDSPYVRRCAVSLKLMDVPFEHRRLSVFRNFDEFRKINPVVKAPTLVCGDGTVLMDSTLILDYVESTLPMERRLLPTKLDARRRALHVIGFALAAADKCVSIVYEKEQRPKEKLHEPWFERVVGQANTAFVELEAMMAGARPWLQGDHPTAADVMTAIAWRFGQYYNAAEIPAAKYPALAAYSQRAESLPEFLSTPLD
jgi:glutathione S-transferase